MQSALRNVFILLVMGKSMYFTLPVNQVDHLYLSNRKCKYIASNPWWC